MFKELAYTYTAQFGHELHVLEIRDSNFTSIVALREQSRHHIVYELTKLYSARKESVARNVAHYYMWLCHRIYSLNSILTLLTDDVNTLSVYHPDLKFERYAKCIKQHIIALRWARGIRD